MRIEIKNILCPIDFSEPSLNALSYAEAMAEAYDAHLHLLHVVEPFYHYGTALFSPVSPKKQADGFLEKLHELQQNRHPTVKSSAEVVVGRPFAQIVKRAREKEIDLIVMGSHGHGGVIHLLIGSVAERVVRKAPCPVLTVKEPGREFEMP